MILESSDSRVGIHKGHGEIISWPSVNINNDPIEKEKSSLWFLTNKFFVVIPINYNGESIQINDSEPSIDEQEIIVEPKLDLLDEIE